MSNNLLFKILSSLPVILITLYFIPFLGVCLILFRYFMYGKQKRISTPLCILIVGLLVLIPKGINIVLDLVNVEVTTIPYLKEIVNNQLYNVDFMNYSKRLICVGVIFLIISYVLKTVFDKVGSMLNSGIKNYVSETQKRDAEISKKNDMEIKIKQEKAKNTSYVKCPNCGSDNLLSEKFGTCKFCRREIENTNYNV